MRLSLGYSVTVDKDTGKISLPDREYSTSELKQIAREVNRAIRQSKSEEDYDGM